MKMWTKKNSLHFTHKCVMRIETTCFLCGAKTVKFGGIIIKCVTVTLAKTPPTHQYYNKGQILGAAEQSFKPQAK